jgi:phosphatidate phosphatase APP1
MRKTPQPTIVVYPGYANHEKVVVFGHVFKQNLRHWYPYSDNFFANLKVLWKLFRVKGVADIKVQLFKGSALLAETCTDERGYFRFEAGLAQPLGFGWTALDVKLAPGLSYRTPAAQGKVLRPALNSFDIISDIDDTLLITHSRNFFKKMRLLIMRHPSERKPFDGVVHYYQQLYLHNSQKGSCLFSYVSSSEWNLYPFIRAFSQTYHLPRGIYLLRSLNTRLGDLVFKGKTDHGHKLKKIQELLTFYPDHRFILLGDDTQKDPVLYMQAVRKHKAQIACVYIRHTRKKPSKEVEAMFQEIGRYGVPYCYFQHSEEALQHSKQMGFM